MKPALNNILVLSLGTMLCGFTTVPAFAQHKVAHKLVGTIEVEASIGSLSDESPYWHKVTSVTPCSPVVGELVRFRIVYPSGFFDNGVPQSTQTFDAPGMADNKYFNNYAEDGNLPVPAEADTGAWSDSVSGEVKYTLTVGERYWKSKDAMLQVRKPSIFPYAHLAGTAPFVAYDSEHETLNISHPGIYMNAVANSFSSTGVAQWPKGGLMKFVQVVSNYSGSAYLNGNPSAYPPYNIVNRLDVSVPYPISEGSNHRGIDGDEIYRITQTDPQVLGDIYMEDGPAFGAIVYGNPLLSTNKLYDTLVTDQHYDAYILFKSGVGNSFSVPLYRIHWGWSGTMHPTSGTTGVVASGAVVDSPQISASSTLADFPTWHGVRNEDGSLSP